MGSSKLSHATHVAAAIPPPSLSNSLFAYCRILLTLAERIFNLQQLQGETLKLEEGASARVVCAVYGVSRKLGEQVKVAGK